MLLPNHLVGSRELANQHHRGQYLPSIDETKVNKNKGWITERCQLRVISEINISLYLEGIKFLVGLM